MSKYSLEDKTFIEQFVSENSLDVFSSENEQKWKELGEKMNRNWEEIRDTCALHWKIQNNHSDVQTLGLELHNNENDCNEYQNFEYIVEKILSEDGVTESCHVIDYVDVDGQFIKVEPFTNKIVNIQSSSDKRQRDVFEAEANSPFVKIFENQSITELELKREEHQEKMKIFKQQLIYGAEVHKEKMKILRAKLRAVEEQVETIDNMICNKNFKKKFKSGPK